MTNDDFATQVIDLMPRLKWRAMRLCFGDEDKAADLLQDTLEKAFKHRDKYREQGAMAAWLYTLMGNMHIDTWKHKQRRPQEVPGEGFLDENGEPTEWQPIDPSPGPEELAIGAEISDELLEALNSINTDFALCWLLFASGLTYDEIATELGIPRGTVMSRLWRGRQILHSKLRHLVA